MSIREIKQLPKDQFMTLPEATEELYEALHKSKEGFIKVRRESDGLEYKGHTYAFGEGISCHMSMISHWWTTSVVQKINWEEGYFDTLNSRYFFEFIEDKKKSNSEPTGSVHYVAYGLDTDPNQGVFMKVINKSPNGLPTRADEGSAGMDVRAWCRNENFIGDGASWDEENKCIRIFSGGRAAIPTGLYFELPKGFEMQVRPRSGLAIKNGITVLNSPGTIDESFRGEVCVILANLSKEPFEVHTGDRIAQLVVQRVEKVQFEEVDRLSETERNDGGFGHSGIK